MKTQTWITAVAVIVGALGWACFLGQRPAASSSPIPASAFSSEQEQKLHRLEAETVAMKAGQADLAAQLAAAKAENARLTARAEASARLVAAPPVPAPPAVEKKDVVAAAPKLLAEDAAKEKPKDKGPGVLSTWTTEIMASLGIQEGFVADRARQVLAEEQKALHEGLQEFYLRSFAPPDQDPAQVRKMPNLVIMSLIKGRHEEAEAELKAGTPRKDIPYFQAWGAFVAQTALPIRQHTYQEMGTILAPDKMEQFKTEVHKPTVFNFGSDGIPIILNFASPVPLQTPPDKMVQP